MSERPLGLGRSSCFNVFHHRPSGLSLDRCSPHTSRLSSACPASGPCQRSPCTQRKIVAAKLRSDDLEAPCNASRSTGQCILRSPKRCLRSAARCAPQALHLAQPRVKRSIKHDKTVPFVPDTLNTTPTQHFPSSGSGVCAHLVELGVQALQVGHQLSHPDLLTLPDHRLLLCLPPP